MFTLVIALRDARLRLVISETISALLRKAGGE